MNSEKNQPNPRRMKSNKSLSASTRKSFWINQTELAKVAKVRWATMRTWVKRWCDNGLHLGLPDPEDKRVVRYKFVDVMFVVGVSKLMQAGLSFYGATYIMVAWMQDAQMANTADLGNGDIVQEIDGVTIQLPESSIIDQMRDMLAMKYNRVTYYYDEQLKKEGDRYGNEYVLQR